MCSASVLLFIYAASQGPDKMFSPSVSVADSGCMIQNVITLYKTICSACNPSETRVFKTFLIYIPRFSGIVIVKKSVYNMFAVFLPYLTF